jgi:uncharacterized membrane protein YbhN (UPF0104 family)
MLLKAIGLLLFLWLLLGIDRSALLTQLRQTNLLLLTWSFLLLLLSYGLKVIRWHLLLRLVLPTVKFRYAWETYNIGTFLGLITPGKLGEFGRAGYLGRKGVAATTAAMLVILDRVFDVAVIALFSVVAVGVLFGTQWIIAGYTAVIVGIGVCALVAFATRKKFPLVLLSRPFFLLNLLLLTALSWGMYCAWSVALAASIGMHVEPLSFMSAIILTGIIALLPIAPSGLGTRDASLILLLRPLGVGASEAVALSFLMFLSIVASSLIGAWYWIKGVSTPR